MDISIGEASISSVSPLWRLVLGNKKNENTSDVTVQTDTVFQQSTKKKGHLFLVDGYFQLLRIKVWPEKSIWREENIPFHKLNILENHMV